MELLHGEDSWFLVQDELALKACQKSGHVTPLNKDDTKACIANAKCFGIVQAFLGTFQLAPQESYLLIVSKSTKIGRHALVFDGKFNEIFQIEEVCALPLQGNGEIPTLSNEFTKCGRHGVRNSLNTLNSELNNAGFMLSVKGFQQKFISQMKVISSQATNRLRVVNNSNCKDRNSDRKLLEEILNIFNDSGNFFYANNIDLTNSVQRLAQQNANSSTDNNRSRPKFDERFFWNRSLVCDLLDNNMTAVADIHRWICPVIQGFVGMWNLKLLGCDLSVSVISRRSVYRAGTRYIKRGINELGQCANFVETEQILSVGGHVLSWLTIRCSVPLFWSQRGYKYRPPPILTKQKAESLNAMEKHFAELLNIYGGQVIVVNLVEQHGREQVLASSFIDHILDYNCDQLTFVAFDFHEHCRALRYENIRCLIDALMPHVNTNRFCWVDKKGQIACEQTGIFRVNCVDCLDRTNVVQAALAKLQLESQLRKLGFLAPDFILPLDVQLRFQKIWADNGDAISQQYAGTAALKGDLTRLGQRTAAGMVRDGYHSANRYYLCHMRDAKRQQAIDALLKQSDICDNFYTIAKENGSAAAASVEEEEKDSEREHLRQFVRDCQRQIVSSAETLVGSWALVDATLPSNVDKPLHDCDMDCIVMLTRQALYVANYDEEMDNYVDCVRVVLEDIQRLEIGPLALVGKGSSGESAAPVCLRIWYKRQSCDADCQFFQWRSASTRLFNNMAIGVKNQDEATEYIHAISEQFMVALVLAQLCTICTTVSRLSPVRSSKASSSIDKKKSRKLLSAVPLFTTTTRSLGSKIFDPSVFNMKGIGNKMVRNAFKKKDNLKSKTNIGRTLSDKLKSNINQNNKTVDSENSATKCAEQLLLSIVVVFDGVGIIFVSNNSNVLHSILPFDISDLCNLSASSKNLHIAVRFYDDTRLNLNGYLRNNHHQFDDTNRSDFVNNSPVFVIEPPQQQQLPLNLTDLSIDQRLLDSGGSSNCNSELDVPTASSDMLSSSSNCLADINTDQHNSIEDHSLSCGSTAVDLLKVDRKLSTTHSDMKSSHSEGSLKLLERRIVDLTTNSFNKLTSSFILPKKEAIAADSDAPKSAASYRHRSQQFYDQFISRIKDSKSTFILL